MIEKATTHFSNKFDFIRIFLATLVIVWHYFPLTKTNNYYRLY